MRGVQAFQALPGDVRIDLRRRDIGMPEHQLYDPQIGAVVEQMGGESVTQHMR